MSNRFKFRAWHKDAKQMLYPDVPADAFNWLDEGQPVEVMQWTCLHDKNGKEIYEGDVIRILSVHSYDFADPDPKTKIIWWDEENSKFGFKWINWKPSTTGYTFCKGNQSLFEVIGNRHENKELLRNDA